MDGSFACIFLLHERIYATRVEAWVQGYPRKQWVPCLKIPFELFSVVLLL